MQAVMLFVTAQQAIQQSSNPMVKLRSLYEGTQKSKLKAKRNIGMICYRMLSITRYR